MPLIGAPLSETSDRAPDLDPEDAGVGGIMLILEPWGRARCRRGSDGWVSARSQAPSFLIWSLTDVAAHPCSSAPPRPCYFLWVLGHRPPVAAPWGQSQGDFRQMTYRLACPIARLLRYATRRMAHSAPGRAPWRQSNYGAIP